MATISLTKNEVVMIKTALLRLSTTLHFRRDLITYRHIENKLDNALKKMGR